MRKLFTCILTFFLIFLSYVVFDFFSHVDFFDKSGNEHPIITLDKIDMSDEAFLKLIYEKCNQYDIILTTSFYPNANTPNLNEAFKVEQYTTDFSRYEKWISKANLPQTNSEYIATFSSDDKNNVGLLPIFNKNHSIEIYFLTEHFPYSLSREYRVLSNNTKNTALFISALKKSGVYCSSLTSNSSTTQIIGYSALKIIITIALLGLLVVWGVFIVINEYKPIGVMRMSGYGVFKSSCHIVKKFLPSFLIGVLSLLLLSFVCLIFYNQLIRYFEYICALLPWVVIAFLLFMLAIFTVTLILTATIKIADVLSNKKPYKVITAINILLKIVIGIVLVFSLNSFNGFFDFQNQLAVNTNRWDVLQGYGELAIYTVPSIKNDYELGVKCKQLFEIENQKGAILIRPDGLLSLPKSRYTSEDHDLKTNIQHPHFWRNNGVMINNNYLKINPILDVTGEKIDLSEHEYDDNLIILVPQKYKKYEETFLKEYVEMYTWSYYVDEDVYRKEQGIEVDTHLPKDVRIIYVKDNSRYFTFTPTIEGDENYYIIDPIGIVVNNVNYGGDTYYSAVSKGELKVKLPNNQTDFDIFAPSIKKCGLEKNIFYVVNAYDNVSRIIYIIRSGVNNVVTLTLLMLISYFGISIFTTIILTNAFKQRIAVQCILGYSLLRRSIVQIILAISLWLVVLIVSAFFFHGSMIVWLSSVIILTAESVIIQIVVSIKNRKSLTKGEIS